MQELFTAVGRLDLLCPETKNCLCSPKEIEYSEVITVTISEVSAAPAYEKPRMVAVRLTSIHEIRERLQILMGLEIELKSPDLKKKLTMNLHRVDELLRMRG